MKNLTMMDAVFTIQSPEEYRSVFNQAEQLRDRGQILQAVVAYYNLLRYRLEWEEREPGLPFTINEFFIVDRLADLSFLIGNKTAARFLLSALAHKTKNLGNIGKRIYVVTKLLLVNLHDGLLDAAFENAQSLTDVIGDIKNIQISPSGLPIWEDNIRFDSACTLQDKADQFICLYDGLGALLLALGRFAEGALMLQRGIQIGERSHSPIVDSRLLSMKILQAKAFFQKGEIQLAKTLLIEIEEDAKSAGIASGIPLHLLDLKSKMALAQGEMGEAYQHLLTIIQLCRQQRLPLAEIHANFNLAKTKILLNQVDEAAAILQDCLIKAESLGEKALVLRVKRFLQIADNRVQATLPSLNYAGFKRPPRPTSHLKSQPGTESESYRRSEDFLNFFEEKALIFQLQLAENYPDKAAETLTQLRLLIVECDSALILARLQVLEFMMLYFTNVPITATFPLQPVLDFLTTNRFLPELWQYRYLLSHTELIPEREKATWIGENQRLLDQITASLPPTMQTLYLLNKWSPNEEYLAGVSDQLFQLKQKVQSAKFLPGRWFAKWRLMKSLVLYQREAKRYKDHLARNIAGGKRPDGFTFATPGTVALGTLWRQPKGTLSVSYLVLPDRVIIISRSFLKIRLYITYINRVILRQLVFALRDGLYPEGKFRTMVVDDESPPPPADLTKLLPHLEKILQLEIIINEHGQKIQHIAFVADDVLHGFPFTLLAWNNTSILDKLSISISIDGQLPERKVIGLSGKNVLIAGVSNAVPGLKDLPGVLSEVKQIHQKLQKDGANVHELLNEKATVHDAKKFLQEVDAAHFSCHGKFDFRQPDQSGLVLAGGDVLTLKDILTFKDLSRIRLLVLSSCRGAEHFILPGRWIIGLPETFCRAGVRAVLAFLWPVDDDFATAFTTRFYEHLKNNIPAESFRLTVLNAKNKQFPDLHVEYWHPRFWAGAIFYER